ncbi:MAG: acyl-ACP desaturase, partial [Mycobacterium sp.]|nr:acyl-ACP desaturase [Mycobacterium sp.]
PVLRKWRIFERTDFSAKGEARREQLATFLEGLAIDVGRFEEQRDRMLAREAAKRELRAG